ncbi:hypothetical protein BSP109_01076 [Brevibacterium sp. Mu109]|uniref:hypothetical protein n=1 Tax=Brevibacterium sp. Mu109 TaxID=1255669 RepID=UPI000C518986|nr:hypothetical protein [Brevibacterium sp. Mu109]SMX74180.1 hypothetical protein BSP109_01076 [Brevibacterium sp. Mu109]
MREFIRPWLWAIGVYFTLDLLISLLVGTTDPLWFLMCPFLAAVAADWVHALHGRPLERDHLIAVFAVPVVLAVSQAIIAAFSGVFAGMPWAYGVSPVIAVAAATVGFGLSAFVRVSLLEHTPETRGYAHEHAR